MICAGRLAALELGRQAARSAADRSPHGQRRRSQQRSVWHSDARVAMPTADSVTSSSRCLETTCMLDVVRVRRPACSNTAFSRSRSPKLYNSVSICIAYNMQSYNKFQPATHPQHLHTPRFCTACGRTCCPTRLRQIEVVELGLKPLFC